MFAGGDLVGRQARTFGRDGGGFPLIEEVSSQYHQLSPLLPQVDAQPRRLVLGQSPQVIP